MENVTLAVAKSYAEELLMGQGSIKGEDGKDGADGVDGFSPIIVENASNTDETYKLDITTKDGTFTTANLIGKQGVQGIQGIQGIQGEQGETGLQGQQGIQGVKGEKGDDGYPFLIYKQYEVGIEEFNEADFPEIGLMFMVHVWEEDKGYPVYRYTADGTDTPYSLVTYMNTEGIKGEKGDRGEQGEQGIAGLDGKDGTTYTPSIGEVTTVDSTELASATVSVNTETKEAVFNFAIPKGEKGLDSVQISDNETVENKTWSSKKTSDEIAKVETEIAKKADKSYVDDNFATMDKVVQCVENKQPNAKTVSFELNSEKWNCGTIYGNTHNGGNFKYDYYVTTNNNIELVKQDVYGQQGGVTASLSGTTLTLTASEGTTIKTVTIINS